MVTNEYLRAEAVRFFEWYPFNLSRLAETLTPEDKQEFERGNLPSTLISAVEATWMGIVKTSLPWPDHFAAVRKALPSQQDYDTYVNCPMGQLQKLPKRI